MLNFQALCRVNLNLVFEVRKEMFYFMMLSTHFIVGYMAEVFKDVPK